jgi:DNA-binding CsgD family transcriptional regulator
MTGIVESKLGSLVDRFYEAALAPALWRTVLAEASDALGAAGVELFPGPESSFALTCSESLDEAFATGFAEGWFKHNPRIERGLPLLKNSTIFTDSMVFSREDLERLPFNADFAHRFGLGSFAAFPLTPLTPSTLFFSVERGAHQPFSRREVELLEGLAPHFRRAGEVASRLADAHGRGILDGLDLMSCGGILLNRWGKAVRSNSRAERYFGRGLTLRKGKLAAGHAESDIAFQRLIGSVVSPDLPHESRAGGAVPIHRPGARPLLVHAAPIVGIARDVFHHGRAVLMIVDPDEHSEPAEPVVRQAFGLTPAEARVAVLVARGLDVSEIALSQGVSEGTIRTQLKAIFAKTETRRQAQLVGVINGATSLRLAA